MSNVPLESIVNVSLAKSLFGEPMYGYFRRYVKFCRHYGNEGSYVPEEWYQISEEEFNDLRRATECRMGGYFEYEKQIVCSGWQRAVIEMLERNEKE